MARQLLRRGWRDYLELRVIVQAAVDELLEAWMQDDPPRDNPCDHGLTTRYREPVATGHWIVFALDTVIDPPSIDV